VFVDRSLASLHWCDRLRGRVPTFVVCQRLLSSLSSTPVFLFAVELPFADVNFRCRAAVACQRQLLYRRRLLAVTFDVCCILCTEFDDYSENLHHLVRVLWITSRTGASRFVVYTTVNLSKPTVDLD